MTQRKAGDPADGGELTARLIDLAAATIAASGVDGLSLRKLAETAGTSTMSVYTRFGSKGALLAAMHREGLRRLGAALVEAAGSSPDPLVALLETGRAYRRSALASPTLYGLMFGPPVPDFVPTADDLAAAAATYEPLVTAVRRCCEATQLSGEPQEIALHLWSVVHGRVSLELAGRLPDVVRATAESYDQALLWAGEPFLRR